MISNSAPTSDLKERLVSSNKHRSDIEAVFAEVYQMQMNQKPPELKDDTVLLETGLDSLGFAILVTRLEEDLGYDPFTISDEAYYPVTFGDFVAFYKKHEPT